MEILIYCKMQQIVILQYLNINGILRRGAPDSGQGSERGGKPKGFRPKDVSKGLRDPAYREIQHGDVACPEERSVTRRFGGVQFVQ